MHANIMNAEVMLLQQRIEGLEKGLLQKQGRIDQLEQQIEGMQTEMQCLESQHSLARMLLQYDPLPTAVYTVSGICVYVNDTFSSIVGIQDTAHTVGDLSDDVRSAFVAVLDANVEVRLCDITREGESCHRYAQVISFCLRDDEGISFIVQRYDVLNPAATIRAARHENKALARLLLEYQIYPIPLGRDVVLIPLKGPLDFRGGDILESRVLADLATNGIAHCIVDLTGVYMIDKSAVESLRRFAQATRLLGCNVLITGITPAVAQKLVSEQISLNGISVYQSLRQALLSLR